MTDTAALVERATAALGGGVAVLVLAPPRTPFETHRALHDAKRRPGVRHVLVVDPETSAAVLHRADGGGWTEALGDVDEFLK